MRSTQLMTEGTAKSSPKVIARQLGGLASEIQTCAARATAATETPLTKELAEQLLTTVAACMINNVAPTLEEAINEVHRTARTATGEAVGPLRSAVAALQEQVEAVKALAESVSLGGSAAAALEKAIAEEEYAKALELVHERKRDDE